MKSYSVNKDSMSSILHTFDSCYLCMLSSYLKASISLEIAQQKTVEHIENEINVLGQEKHVVGQWSKDKKFISYSKNGLYIEFSETFFNIFSDLTKSHEESITSAIKHYKD